MCLDEKFTSMPQVEHRAGVDLEVIDCGDIAEHPGANSKYGSKFERTLQLAVIPLVYIILYTYIHK